MKRRNWKAWLLGGALCANLCIGYLFAREQKAEKSDDVYAQIDAYMEVLQLVRTHYVEGEKTQASDLFRNAIFGMLDGLDPFSDYFENEDKELLQEMTDGEFGGIGIQIDFKEKYMVVVAPIDGTPAYEAGLQTGDMILKVNEESVETLGMDKTIRRMRGEPGSKVRLTYMREGFREPREIELVRAMIPIESVTNAKVIDGIGYVRVTQFMEKTAQELKAVLEKTFSGDDVKGLIIDLRDNPGGLLNSAVDICSYFLPEKAFVVSVEGRTDSREELARGGYKFKDVPIVILVSKGSASAAEIMSGCMKYHGRSTLIGEKTFGKGSVQSIFELKNGNELKLTIAYYYVEPKTKADRMKIHGNGITPDVVVQETDAERKARAEKLKAFRKSLDDGKPSERERIKKMTAYREQMWAEDKVLKTALDFFRKDNGNARNNGADKK